MKKILLVTVFMAWSALAQQPEAPIAPALTTVVETSERLQLVADSFERTLYVFDPDQNQPAPKCAADCAEVWPPYLVSAAEATALQAPLGSIARANKKLQLTIDGRPVYTYFLDRAKGDNKGNGLGGVWHQIEIQP